MYSNISETGRESEETISAPAFSRATELVTRLNTGVYPRFLKNALKFATSREFNSEYSIVSPRADPLFAFLTADKVLNASLGSEVLFIFTAS